MNPERAAAIAEARARYAAALCDAAIACSRDLADGVEPLVAVATMLMDQRRALDAAIASVPRVPAFHSGGIVNPSETPIRVRDDAIDAIGYSMGFDHARPSGRDVSPGVVVMHPDEWRRYEGRLGEPFVPSLRPAGAVPVDGSTVIGPGIPRDGTIDVESDEP